MNICRGKEGTERERRRQTLCDKRDINNLRQTSPWLKKDLSLRTLRQYFKVKITAKLVSNSPVTFFTRPVPSAVLLRLLTSIALLGFCQRTSLTFLTCL